MTTARFAYWLAILCVALIAVLTVMRDDVRRLEYAVMAYRLSVVACCTLSGGRPDDAKKEERG